MQRAKATTEAGAASIEKGFDQRARSALSRLKAGAGAILSIGAAIGSLERGVRGFLEAGADMADGVRSIRDAFADDRDSGGTWLDKRLAAIEKTKQAQTAALDKEIEGRNLVEQIVAEASGFAEDDLRRKAIDDAAAAAVRLAHIRDREMAEAESAERLAKVNAENHAIRISQMSEEEKINAEIDDAIVERGRASGEALAAAWQERIEILEDSLRKVRKEAADEAEKTASEAARQASAISTAFSRAIGNIRADFASLNNNDLKLSIDRLASIMEVLATVEQRRM